MTAMRPFFSLMVTETQPDGSAERISDIPLDVRLSSTHTFTSQVSENPVEAGSVVSDHVIRNPPSISLSGLVGDTPIGTASTSPPSETGQVRPGTRPIGAYHALYYAWKKASPITIIDELGLFEDYVISSLTVPRDREQGGDAVYFSLELQHITVVESLSASLAPDIISKLKRRRSKTKAKISAAQNEQAARTAQEVAAGKVSTTTPTTAQSTAGTCSASTYAGGAGR